MAKKTIITRSNTAYRLYLLLLHTETELRRMSKQTASIRVASHGDRIDQSKSFLIVHSTVLPNIAKESYPESKAHLCLFMND